jgi:predicted phosphodiesterase
LRESALQESTLARPGRRCPPEYGYSPRIFARAADFRVDVLYVVGGLYGNLPALHEVQRMAALERPSATLLFNGDFHWFDCDADAFTAIDTAVSPHIALRGNVETEATSDDDANGCGCAYPESVPDADVDRSNRIMRRLRTALRAAERRSPGMTSRMAALPMHGVIEIGDARIAVVHGDAWSLAGWRFAADALHSPDSEPLIRHAFELAAVDVFACTHTCLPALKLLDTSAGDCVIVNNGAAGMPNFRGRQSGLITRIATQPVPQDLAGCRAYGVDAAGVFIDALEVRFDTDAWDAEFRRLWPEGSAAAVSYGRRIVDGPDYSIDDALGRVAPRACSAATA